MQLTGCAPDFNYTVHNVHYNHALVTYVYENYVIAKH